MFSEEGQDALSMYAFVPQAWHASALLVPFHLESYTPKLTASPGGPTVCNLVFQTMYKDIFMQTTHYAPFACNTQLATFITTMSPQSATATVAVIQ